MADLGIILIAAAVVLAVVAFFLGRRRGARPRSEVGAEQVTDPSRPRARVADFHVRGDQAQVYFDVEVPSEEVDDFLRELLLHEAVEVVREKRHTLPIDEVHQVVAFAKRGGEHVEVGRLRLTEPGILPPPSPPPVLVGRRGGDPLEDHFSEAQAAQAPPRMAAPEAPREGDLPPAGQEARLPASVEAALMAQGLEPKEASAGELVVGLLRLAGYSVRPLEREGTFMAERRGVRTYIRSVPHRPGEHPELAEEEVDRFILDFVSSGAGRGLLVSDKFGPFEIYARERRDPRIRFITRERLQGFLDALALT